MQMANAADMQIKCIFGQKWQKYNSVKFDIGKLRTIHDQLLFVVCVWGIVCRMWKSEVADYITTFLSLSYLFMLLVLIYSSWRTTHSVWLTVKENGFGFLLLTTMAILAILLVLF